MACEMANQLGRSFWEVLFTRDWRNYFAEERALILCKQGLRPEGR
jgi:hypothetical protein